MTASLYLGESYALLRRALPPARVLYWLARLLASPRVEVVYDARALVDRARSVLAAYGDQKFSLADAVSFVVMRDRGLREALAFDRHFQTAGFTLVPMDYSC